MLKVSYKEIKITSIKSISLPLGIDKSQYNIKKNSQYNEVTSIIEEAFGDKTKSIELFCFYCGSETRNYIPNFLHDTSGKNTWLVGDLRSGSVICKDCHSSYGLSNIRYLDHVVDMTSYQSKDLKRLLSFEPEILIPSLEPAYLHFKYKDDGYLKPLTNRAERTINAFNLNRQRLVSRRLKSIQDYIYSSKSTIKDYLASPYDFLFCQKGFSIDSNENYRVEDKNKLNSEIDEFNRMSPLYQIPVGNEKIPYKSVTFQKNEGKEKHDFSNNFSGISSFVFSGIRGFHDAQKIEFYGKGSIIILGENGVGKSTFLDLFKRAVKQKSRRSLDDICSRDVENSPSYKLLYNGFNEEQTYIEREKTRIKRSHCNLIHIGDSRVSKSSINQLINWINSKRNNQDIIDWVANRLSLLLDLPSGYYFHTEEGEVFWTDKNKYDKNLNKKNKEEERILINELSSGYNSILYIFYKIVSSISNHNDNLKDINLRLSSSIVLIDEVELHLHPKFKKRVVRNIQDAFPEVIFIFTTHDPLVIKSINEGTKLLRFENCDGKTRINNNLPDPRGLSTEQILTSPHFGLDTIDDNDLQPLIDRYNLEIKNKNWEVVSELRMSLFQMGYFGKTYRELIALSAVDAYFRDGQNPTVEEITGVLRRKDSHND